MAECKYCDDTGLRKGNFCNCLAGAQKYLQMDIDICTAMITMMKRLTEEARERERKDKP